MNFIDEITPEFDAWYKQKLEFQRELDKQWRLSGGMSGFLKQAMSSGKMTLIDEFSRSIKEEV